MLYPWLNEPYKQLQQLTVQERLPHALLFVGPTGLGKQELALTFSQFLHCHSPKGTLPCDTCDACTLFNAGSHPDHLLVRSEERRVGKECRSRWWTEGEKNTEKMTNGGERQLKGDEVVRYTLRLRDGNSDR